MAEIDQMDMLGFLQIRAWNVRQKAKKKEPQRTTIDKVWPGLRSGL